MNHRWEGFFLHSKHGPNLNMLQTGTGTPGQCQCAVGEPRHISLHIFLLRLPSCSLSCIPSISLPVTCHGCRELTGRVLSIQGWSQGCELGQQHEQNLCLSPGLCSQQLLPLARFAYGLGRAGSESTVLHGWGHKICLLWTCSCCNAKPAFGDARKRSIEK